MAFAAILLAVLCVAAGRAAAASAATASSVVLTADTTTPATGGQVTFTVTATNPNGLSAGTFTLYANGTSFASALAPTSSDSTTATLTYSWPFSNTTTVTASYGSGFAKTTSNAVTITPGTVAPTATVNLTATPLTTGQGDSVSFSVSVTGSGSSAVPTGTVTLWDAYNGGSPQSVATLTLDSSGSATAEQAGFQGGSHVFTATYSGDGTYPSTGSSPVTIQITPTPSLVQTTITASASPNPVPAGGAATLSAHIVQQGTTLPATNGEVTFRNAANNALIATAPVDASGNASVTVGGWKAAEYTILAQYVGSSSSNFQSSSGSLTLTAAAANVTVTAPSLTTTYGTIPSSLTPTYSGGPAPQTPAQCTTAATATSAPGTYAITCSGASDPSDSFSYVDGTLTVVPATLTISPVAATMVAGAPVPTLTPTITGWVNGESAGHSDVTGAPSCTTTATSQSAPGTYPITCTVGTLASTDYRFVVAGSADVTVVAPTPLTVTAPSASMVYGGTVPALPPTYSVANPNLTTPAICTTTATSSSPVGTYAVTCSGASGGGYAITYVAGTLTIQPAQLSVHTPSATMTAGSQVPALTPTITGFVNGDTAAAVSGAASCTTTATSASDPGTYPVTCTVGTLAAANYTFAVVGTGTVTVTPSTTPTRIVAWVSGPVVAGKPVLLTASLFAGARPLGGKTVTLTLGSSSCTATTLPLLGLALCLVTAPEGPAGPTTATASFAGDAQYGASSDSNPVTLVVLPRHGRGDDRDRRG